MRQSSPPRHRALTSASRSAWAVPAVVAMVAAASIGGIVSALAVQALPAAGTTSGLSNSMGTYSIWDNGTSPTSPADSDVRPAELGTRFSSSESGYINAIRFYNTNGDQSGTEGKLWSTDGRVLARATFANNLPAGWVSASLETPVLIQAGTDYVASYSAPTGRYADDQWVFSKGAKVSNGPLTASGGVYSYDSSLPHLSWNDSSYYADVTFSTGAPNPTDTTTSMATSSTPTTSVAAATTTTSTTSSSAPSPTGTPAQVLSLGNCAPAPSACGFPDASNTGVPTGLALKSVPGAVTSGQGWHYDSRGWISVDTAGAVLDGITTSASLDITASNVTIRDSRITSSGESWGIALRHTSNVTIKNIEISSPTALGPARLMVGIKDIYGDSSGLVVQASDIAHAGTGIQVEAGTIADNYIHDFGFTEGDHLNGITSNGGTGVLAIRHNTILNSFEQTDAVGLFQDFGPQANRVIDNNLLAGGGYTIYAGANPGKENNATNIAVSNNRISRIYFPNGGYYGPATAYNPSGGNTWLGNVWDDTNSPISRP